MTARFPVRTPSCSLRPRTCRIKDGVASTWVYDSIYRLTAQQESGQAATFVYDASGNITAKHHQGSDPTSMTYDAANRLVTTQQGSTLGTYTFDANGNMTVEQVAGSGLLNTFVYDEENRLLNEIRVSGARHTCTYEPDGLRRSAFHAGTASVVTFIWDGDDLLNERIEGANAARYAVLDGEVLSEERGASRYRFVPDPLGSVRAVLDTSGSIIATRDYWPYGEVAAQSGGMTAIQFVGALGYFTDTTNRVYIRARHYRPDLGRWVTEDPMGRDADDRNLYRYVSSRPVLAVDPMGLAVSLCSRTVLCVGDFFDFGHDYYFQHWYFLTDLCGDVGWGPHGVIMPPEEHNWSEGDQPRCHRLSVSSAVERCICTLGRNAMRGWFMCRWQWDKEHARGLYSYWPWGTNCQSFVQCILSKCLSNWRSHLPDEFRSGCGSRPDPPPRRVSCVKDRGGYRPERCP